MAYMLAIFYKYAGGCGARWGAASILAGARDMVEPAEVAISVVKVFKMPGEVPVKHIAFDRYFECENVAFMFLTKLGTQAPVHLNHFTGLRHCV